jgi:hypothetical protein
MDIFISPILIFEGNIPIPAILISARPPGDESVTDPFTRASASASKTQVGKWNAAANLAPQKKAKKTAGKSPGGIKINELAPKVHTPTPPSGPQARIPIHESKRYAC